MRQYRLRLAKPNAATLSMAIGLILSGCVQYRAADLSTTPHFATTQIDPQSLQHFPSLRAYVFNPEQALDVVAVEQLALSQNPTLLLARRDLGIAQAQAYAVGLLPDPQINLAHDVMHSSDAQASSSYGISYDFGALLAHSSTVTGAKAATQQAALDLLWQEWQVIGQVQLLMVRAQMQNQILVVLNQQQQLAEDRAARSDMAAQQGSLTRDVANADAVALQAIKTKVDDEKTLQLATRHDLNDLLGMSPMTTLNLTFDDGFGSGVELGINQRHVKSKKKHVPQAVNAQLIQIALDHLATRRPDLMALQAGYASQEAKVHQAILAQFPALNVGLTRNKDNAGVVSDSLGITLTLPIFNRNRGNIAIEQATRQKMHDEYQQRLNQTVASVLRLQSEQQQQVMIWRSRYNKLNQLRQDVSQAETVYKQGLLDDLLWINLNNNLLNQELDLLNVEQVIREQSVGLNTLLGLPVVQTQTEETMQ